MRFFETVPQHHRPETPRASEASDHQRLVSEKLNCSPRAAVAFSAFSAVAWMRRQIAELAGRLTLKRNTMGDEKVAAKPRELIADALGGLNTVSDDTR